MKTCPPFRLNALVLLLAVTGCLLVAGRAAAQAPDRKLNLLKNPSFENNFQGWEISSNKKKGQVSLDGAEIKDGKPSLRIENSGEDDTMVVQKVSVKPKTRYRLSAMIKTKDVVPAKAGSNGGAVVAIRGGYEKSESVEKTKAWRTVTFEFDTGPKTEIEVGPRLGFYSATVTGTAWFAEVSLVELGPARR